MPAVEVRLAGRAGEIQVSVRTADTGLQTSLRQGLSTLSNSLERAGYHAETYIPRDGTPLEARAKQDASGNGRDSEPSHSGKHSGDAQQQRQDTRQQRDRTRWIDELEEAL
jgi:hypothetical protein